MNTIRLTLISAAVLLATAASAASVPSVQLPAGQQLIAREASEGPRGKDPRVAPASEETIAREAEKRGNDDGKGHRVGDEQRDQTIAREAEQRGNDDGKGHRVGDEQRDQV